MIDKLDWKIRRNERARLKNRIEEAKERLRRLEEMNNNAHSESFKNFTEKHKKIAQERLVRYEDQMKIFKLSGKNC